MIISTFILMLFTVSLIFRHEETPQNCYAKNEESDSTSYVDIFRVKQNKVEFRGSRLARSPYSQNIQRGPPLWEYQEVLWRFAFFCYKPISICK